MIRRILTTTALAGVLASAAAAQELTDPIKLTLHDWTGQLITTQIMGEVLKKAGYNVEYVQADYLAQFAGLETGDLHVAMEIWETTGQDAMDEAAATGQVENLGETGMQAIEEWWYPAYMKEKCPGLPDWEALKDRMRRGLRDARDRARRAAISAGPVTWGGFDDERVEALGLPFEVSMPAPTPRCSPSSRSAYQRQAPILLWIYAPHWAPIKYKGEWVAFPPYEPPATPTRPGAANPDATYDCGKPRGQIWKVGWAGAKGQVAGRLQGDQGLHRSTTTRWAR